MNILITLVNLVVIGSTAMLSTILFIVYLLNVFKKRSVLEGLGLYGESKRSISFWLGVFSAGLCAFGFVQSDDALFGLSVGASLILFLIALVLFALISDGISAWFKNLPES